MYSAIIVDDEPNGLKILQLLLERYVSDVEVIGIAGSAAEGIRLIETQQPDIVFLDVQMPHADGFSLLSQLKQKSFHLIFTTAHHEYALQALKEQAIDYLLKPVDIDDLLLAMEKIREKDRQTGDAVHVLKTEGEKNNLMEKISLHHKGKVVFVELRNICYIEADSEYSIIYTDSGERISASKSLKRYEQLLEAHGGFLRISKSVIVNLNFIKDYSKGEVCVLSLTNGAEFQVSRRKKAEIIDRMSAGR